MNHKWFADYEKKLNETGNEQEAIEYADGYSEREMELLELIADAAREQI